MADTFGQVWRRVRLHCPTAPPMLAQYWVEKAYRDVCDLRSWSWLRAESQFLVSTQRTGTVNVTRGSAAVSGGSMAYSASDADRQFRVGGSGIPYTIISATGSSYTLDRPFGGDTATATTASVLDAYVTCPSDFRRFIAVLDPQNQMQLNHLATEEELNSADPHRTSVGSPRSLASRRFATAGSLVGRVQYELWPYQTSQAHYPFFYIRDPEALVDDTEFLGPLSVSSNVLVTMALAEAAEWPGTETQKNPYRDPTLAALKRKEANANLDRMQVLDEEIYLTWWDTSIQSRYSSGMGTISAAYRQSHLLMWP